MHAVYCFSVTAEASPGSVAAPSRAAGPTAHALPLRRARTSPMIAAIRAAPAIRLAVPHRIRLAVPDRIRFAVPIPIR